MHNAASCTRGSSRPFAARSTNVVCPDLIAEDEDPGLEQDLNDFQKWIGGGPAQLPPNACLCTEQGSGMSFVCVWCALRVRPTYCRTQGDR